MNKKQLVLAITTIVFAVFFDVAELHAQDVVLEKRVCIYTDTDPNSPIGIAIKALQRDMKRVLGAELVQRPLSSIDTSGIVLLNAAQTTEIPSSVTGFEAHRLNVKTINGKPQLLLEGSDVRGTIYALYTFSEKMLGVPPLWYFSSWVPVKKEKVVVKAATFIHIPSPSVKFRAWFPNDTDLFEPWRRRSNDNYELWLETALRLKLNTIEWFDDERDYAKPYSVSRTTKLINDYGLLNTTHHHSPLNATFAGWNDYWRKVKNIEPPALSLANSDKLEEFWRYNIESIVRNKIDMLWVLGFRGNGDHPFWYSFKDAPQSMEERGKIISKMMERQRQLVVEVTKNPNPPIRTIFYDELSDLLAKGFIEPPADSSFIWTYVASRRDHFPNLDIQSLDKAKNLSLGYYFNYQFTSTGSHLAPAEGPWKMERNYRYVASKSNKPIAFSVVNAGNLRDHMMELNANAEMMWDLDGYNSSAFLKSFSATYFGSKHAKAIAKLYQAYYNAYWNQRKTDLPNFERQYIFQDLRYNRALKDIAAMFNKPIRENPLIDISAEQVANRTYNIVPQDNQANTVVQALLNGTRQSGADFLRVAKKADAIYAKLDGAEKVFFNDNLRQFAWFMHHLNQSLNQLAGAYQAKADTDRKMKVEKTIAELQQAQKALQATQHDQFAEWYKTDRVFGINNVLDKLKQLVEPK